MPHYVTQLDDEGDDVFVVYSTIVDNTITGKMSAADMKAWLVDHEYTSWLTQDPAFGLERYDEEMRASIIRMREEDAREGRMYWNDEHGFQFCKYTDYWFTLPRGHWRYD